MERLVSLLEAVSFFPSSYSSTVIPLSSNDQILFFKFYTIITSCAALKHGSPSFKAPESYNNTNDEYVVTGKRSTDVIFTCSC